MEIEIIPGILEQEWSAIERKFALLRPFAKTIHIDILDGQFAPNTTFLDPKPFAKYATDFILEVHMMVDDPLQYLEPFAQAGFRRFLGHIEKMPDQAAFVTRGQELGEVGLVLDGPTPLDSVQISFDDLDSVLFFTADKAGFSGQPFKHDRLEKVKKLHDQKSYLPLEVDGGTTLATITESVAAGVTRFVATSAIFKNENPQKAYEDLLEKATNAAAALV